MTQRPYVVLSCAISLDGCLDSTGPDRLVLSGAEDLDRVDAERAAADAILVGAGTVRRDDPRLLVRAPARRAARVAQGRPEHPVGVTVTASGDLDPRARFFTRVGEAGPVPPAAARRLVYGAGGGRGRAAGPARWTGRDGPGGRGGAARRTCWPTWPGAAWAGCSSRAAPGWAPNC